MKTLRTSLVLALVLSSAVFGIGCGSDSKKVTVVDAAADHVSTDGQTAPDTSLSNDASIDSDAVSSDTGSADALVQDDGGIDVAKDAPVNLDVAAADARVD